MFRAPKRSNPNVTAILPNNAIKTRPWNKIHDLRKEGLAYMHGNALIQIEIREEVTTGTRCRFKSTPK
jgi:hypothetical protein